ncbi:MAG TPA: hypothetical protein QGG70_03835 [Candidatus Pacearchaeota archaeon]|jgi:hypothetical protein|nr:hypothetical protein [Candidatus Pacearchaeota archaeon]
MDWFKAKQALTKGRSGRSISKSAKLPKVDERIASKIEKFQKDEQALRKSKQRTRYNINRFYEITERIKERRGISFEIKNPNRSKLRGIFSI